MCDAFIASTSSDTSRVRLTKDGDRLTADGRRGKSGRQERVRSELARCDDLPIRRDANGDARAEVSGERADRIRAKGARGQPRWGKRLYVANQNAPTISQYDVGAGGVLTPKSPATVKAGVSAESVAVAPDGRSVYVTAYSIVATGREAERPWARCRR